MFYPGGRGWEGRHKKVRVLWAGKRAADYPPPHLAQFAGHKHKLKKIFKFMSVAGELRERRIISYRRAVVRRPRGGGYVYVARDLRRRSV